MHLLGTHYASPAARTCISSCTHMHSHLFSCIVFMFMCLSVIAWCFEFVMLCFKSYYIYFGTNLNLIKFCVLFYVCAPGFFVFCFYVQISPTKHSAPKRPTSKRACTDSDNFKSVETDLKYNDCYKRATIIMEWVVKLDTLKDTFIPEVFKERT